MFAIEPKVWLSNDASKSDCGKQLPFEGIVRERYDSATIAIATGSPDVVGRLLLDNGVLIAVIVRLSEQHHENAGMWAIEYSPSVRGEPPLFATAEDAAAWIEGRKSSNLHQARAIR